MQRKKYHTWLNPSPERNGRPSVQPRTSRWRNVTGTQQSEDHHDQSTSSLSDGEEENQVSHESSSSPPSSDLSALDRIEYDLVQGDGAEELIQNEIADANTLQVSDESSSNSSSLDLSALDRIEFDLVQGDGAEELILNEIADANTLQVSDESSSNSPSSDLSALDRIEFDLVQEDGAEELIQNEIADANTLQVSDESSSNSSSLDLSALDRIEDNNYENEFSFEEQESTFESGDEEGQRDEPYFAEVFEALKQKLTTSFSEVLEAQPLISPAEILLNALTLVQARSFNFSQFEGTMKLINTIFKKPVVPDTRYKLDSLLKSLSGMHYYFVCQNCFSSLGEITDYKNVKSVDCTNCNSTNNVSNLNDSLVFVMFDLPPQIEVLLSSDNMFEKLRNPQDFLNKEGPLILKDVYQGEMYQKFIATLDFNSGIVHITLCFSVDGVALYTSSNTEFWPLFCSILELPPYERAHNLLLGGLWFGKKHIIQDLFLGPFVQHCKKLSTDGFKIMLNKEEKLMKAHCICCCADAPARAAFQCLRQHGGAYSCHWCLHPGENRLFKTLNYEPMRRTKEEILADGTAALHVDDSPNPHVNGVMGISPLLSLQSMDIVKGMILEYFHACAHGVAKAMIGAWLGDNGCEVNYYIGKPSTIKLMDERIKLIKLPVEGRKPARAMSDLKHWKGRDYENFILYLSVPVLLNILPGRYLTHWTLFVQANHLLLQDEVPEENFPAAHVLLMRFSHEMEALYHEHMMTYNLHIICYHLVENCRNWGPLWCINGYSFEGGNKDLKNKIHANLGVSSQVCRALSHEKSCKVLQSEIGNAATEKFENDLKKKVIDSCVFIDKDKYYGYAQKYVPTPEERFILNREGLNTESFVVKHRLVHDGCVYSAVNKHTSLHDNSVALLKDERFVLIDKVIVSEQERKGFLISKQIISEPYLVPYGLDKRKCFLRKITFINREPILVESSMTRISCCRLTQPHGDFLVKVPNIYNTT